MRYLSKQWLSPAYEESGSMIIKASTTPVEHLWRSYAEKPCIEAEIMFRACHGEPLLLDFDVRGHEALQKRKDKINLMIDELTKFREQLDILWAQAEADGAQWLLENPEDDD